jgi:hypothetical protein
VSWLSRGLLTAYVVSIAAVCGVLVLYGPQMRAAAEAHEARTIAEEDRAFCAKLGAGPETGRFGECASGLMEIRTRYLQRSTAESIL